MRQWTAVELMGTTRRRVKSPVASPRQTLASRRMSSSGYEAHNDDLATLPAAADWDNGAHVSDGNAFLPLAQQLHLAQQSTQHQELQYHSVLMSSSSSSSDALAPPSFQHASGFHCPICLRSELAPIRQDCGHVLCLQCTHQAISMIGSCPLCRTQLFFGARNDAGPEIGHRGPQSRSERISVQAMHARIPTQSQAFEENSYTAHSAHEVLDSRGTPTSDVLLDSTARDLHSDAASELSLQLDSLSDFGDMMDLSDLVASDSELSRYSSLGPAAGLVAVRKARAPRRRVASAAKAAALPRRYVAKRTPSTSSVDVATAAGKKRKRKTPELVDQSFVWSQVPTEGERPSERYDCGFAMFEDKLIVVGGIVGNQRLNDLYLLDALESPPRWVKPPVTGTPPPTGSLLQTFVIGGMLYVIGGTTDGKFLNELHAINLKSGEWKWERLAIAGQPPSMRYWYSVSVLDGMAILYGGYGHPKRLSDTFALRFDTEVPTWMEMHPGGDLPGPCSTHSVCVYVNKMYIFGGYDGKSRRSQLHALTIDSKSLESIDCTWEQVSTLGKRPSPRYTHSSASIGSKMIVYGGNSGCLKGDVHILEFENVELPTWKLVRCDHAPLPREWHRAVVHNDAMYVFGGHTSEGNENKLFALTAKPAASA